MYVNMYIIYFFIIFIYYIIQLINELVGFNPICQNVGTEINI